MYPVYTIIIMHNYMYMYMLLYIHVIITCTWYIYNIICYYCTCTCCYYACICMYVLFFKSHMQQAVSQECCDWYIYGLAVMVAPEQFDGF